MTDLVVIAFECSTLKQPTWRSTPDTYSGK